MSFNIFATATSDIPLANLDANFTMIGSSAVASTLYPTATTSITYGTTGTTHYFSGSGLAVTGIGTFGSGNTGIILRELVGNANNFAIYNTALTPSGTNYALCSRFDNSQTIVNANTYVFQSINDTIVTTVTSTGLAVTGTLSASGNVSIGGSELMFTGYAATYYGNVRNKTYVYADVNGYYIGAVNRDVLFVTNQNVAITGVLSATGVVTFSNYGVGTATFNGSGVISSVSDETWKVKDGAPVDTDAMLNKLQPGYWYYNDEKKETFGKDRQLGFYAQNVNAAIGPEAAPEPETVTTKNDDGTETSVTKPWGYYDRSVLAVTVMSLQKALATIESLTARITALEAK